MSEKPKDSKVESCGCAYERYASPPPATDTQVVRYCAEHRVPKAPAKK